MSPRTKLARVEARVSRANYVSLSRSTISILSGLLLVTVLGGALGACRATDTTGPDQPSTDRLVLTFYYPWYGRPDGPSGKWYHWNPETEHNDATHTPLLGLYDSNDPEVVRTHILWARAAGIDAFISSWWGPATFEDGSLGVLLNVAEQENFKVSALLELAFTRDQLRDFLRTLIATHAQSTAWLRVDGRPVVFVYARLMDRFSADDFRHAFDGTQALMVADTHDAAQAAPFDGVFSYGPVEDVPRYLRELPAQRAEHQAAGRVFAAATLPGYDDRVIRHPGRLLPRADGDLFRSMWAAAAGADWITLTSFNEWHEGTEIEPSLEHGTRYLQLTRTLSDDWRRMK